MPKQKKARSYTQEHLAERCGFTVKFFSSIERGLVNVPLQSLVAIAHGLGVTLSELMLNVDGAAPREVRNLEHLLAGKNRKKQIALARVLTAMSDLSMTLPPTHLTAIN